MFELYKKVDKSIQYPNGAKFILRTRSPFGSSPCLLCISAQDQDDKSIYGFAKAGASMARIRVKGNDGARIPLNEIPVSILSIKSKGGIEEDNIIDFVGTYIRPFLLEKKGLAKSKEEVMKIARNINILSNCDGTQRALGIIDEIKQTLNRLNFDSSETNEILSQISLLSFQTEVNLENCPASVIDFHNVNDNEAPVNSKNISDDMISSLNNSKNGESVEKIENRIEVLIDGEDSHYINDYLENGEAMPIIVHTIVSSVLENSIENQNEDQAFNPLSIEELFKKAKTVLERIDKGENKEDLLEELDSSLKYGGQITRLSDRELMMTSILEQYVDAYVSIEEDLRNNTRKKIELQDMIKKILLTSKEVCTEETYYRIWESSGWQLSQEQKEIIENSKTDKETIESQDKQINKLQEMLKTTLKFSEDVRNSLVGKIFFRKRIKELPAGKENER